MGSDLQRVCTVQCVHDVIAFERRMDPDDGPEDQTAPAFFHCGPSFSILPPQPTGKPPPSESEHIAWPPDRQGPFFEGPCSSDTHVPDGHARPAAGERASGAGGARQVGGASEPGRTEGASQDRRSKRARAGIAIGRARAGGASEPGREERASQRGRPPRPPRRFLCPGVAAFATAPPSA